MAQSAANGVEVDSTQRSGDLVVMKTVVNFADLNLSREAGVRSFIHRVKVAINSHGGTDDDPRFSA
jgi:hypothetical protein